MVPMMRSDWTGVKLEQLPCQHCDDVRRFGRQVKLGLPVDDLPRHLQCLHDPYRAGGAQLGKHAEHHVDQLRALFDQQLAHAVQR